VLQGQLSLEEPLQLSAEQAAPSADSFDEPFLLSTQYQPEPLNTIPTLLLIRRVTLLPQVGQTLRGSSVIF